MPGFIVNQDSIATCFHQGKATTTPVELRVMVMSKPIVVGKSIYKIIGCPFNAAGAPSPCTNTLSMTWELPSTKVTANGVPLILTSSNVKCIPNATPLIITATQKKVSAL